jgi:hypothetical protein
MLRVRLLSTMFCLQGQVIGDNLRAVHGNYETATWRSSPGRPDGASDQHAG